MQQQDVGLPARGAHQLWTRRGETSIGTVEGRLEGLNIHGKKRFFIYDVITQRQVVCEMSGRIEWQQIRDAIGKRVAATGRIQSRRTGERVSIIAHRFEVLLDDSELPSADEVLGLLKTAN